MNMKELTLLNFSDVYPDEASCVEALRRFREAVLRLDAGGKSV